MTLWERVEQLIAKWRTNAEVFGHHNGSYGICAHELEAALCAEGLSVTACEYCNALWERRGRWHRHPEGTTFAYECAATVEEYEILHRCDHGAIVRKLAAGTECVEQDDLVKCGCDEYPECTHVLYWHQGFKAGLAALHKEGAGGDFETWLEQSEWWDRLLSEDCIRFARDAWNASPAGRAEQRIPQASVIGLTGNEITCPNCSIVIDVQRAEQEKK